MIMMGWQRCDDNDGVAVNGMIMMLWQWLDDNDGGSGGMTMMGWQRWDVIIKWQH